MLPLSKGEVGKSYIYVGFSDTDEIEKRLLNMGFTKGVTIKVVSKSGKGDMVVLLRDVRLALSKEISEYLIVNEPSKEEETNFTTLDLVKVGSISVVEGIIGKGSVKRHLMDMGLTRGVEVFVRKVAPLGDPIEINVRGYELTLRKDEARRIMMRDVEAVSNGGN